MSDTKVSHVTLVLDRSGSMYDVRDDAIGGFNAFVEQQRTGPGRATLTLVQFDDVVEEVYRGKPMEEVTTLDHETFVPRGQTALYDALGRSVAETREYVKGLDESARPDLVVIAVLTDGRENASKEYNYAKIRSVLDEVNGKPGWQVLFLAADMDVVQEAQAMGFAPHTTLHYQGSPHGTRAAFDMISSHVTSLRGAPDSSPPEGPDDPGPRKH